MNEIRSKCPEWLEEELKLCLEKDQDFQTN